MNNLFGLLPTSVTWDNKVTSTQRRFREDQSSKNFKIMKGIQDFSHPRWFVPCIVFRFSFHTTFSQIKWPRLDRFYWSELAVKSLTQWSNSLKICLLLQWKLEIKVNMSDNTCPIFCHDSQKVFLVVLLSRG